jgi:hypothetical protein
MPAGNEKSSDRASETVSLDNGTVDFVKSVPAASVADDARREGFIQGATWSLRKIAAWLETANIVANNEVAQRAVDATKALIADQARQAAAQLRAKK